MTSRPSNRNRRPQYRRWCAVLAFLLPLVTHSQTTDTTGNGKGRAFSTGEQMRLDYMHQLDTATSEEQRAITMGGLAALLDMIGHHDEAVHYADSALALATALRSDTALLDANYAQIAIHRRSGEYDQALLHARMWLDLMQRSGIDSLRTGSVYKVVGAVQLDAGLYHNALDTLQISLDILQAHSTPYSISTCLDMIANVYSELGNDEQERHYRERAVEQLRLAGGSRNLPALLLNSARLAMRQGRYQDAEDSIEEAARSTEEKGYVYYEGRILECRAELAAAQGEHGKAIGLFERANSIYSNTGDTVQLKRSRYDLAKNYRAMDRIEDALQVMEGLAPGMEHEQSESFRSRYFLLLSQLYEENGQAIQAFRSLKAHEQSSTIADSLAAMRQARDLEAQFRHSQQKLTIAEREREIEIQENALAKSAARNRLLVFGLSAAGLLILLTWLWYRQRIRNQRQEAQIELNQALIDTTEEERERIARELHDGTGSLLTGIKLSLDRLHLELPDSADKESLGKTIGHVQAVAKEVRRVSHAMAPAAIERLSFEKVVQDLLHTFSQIGTAEIQHTISGDTETMSKTERLMLYRILQECLNNSFKHANASEIRVSISVLDNEAELLYQDNGNGYDSEAATNGIGLHSIERRIRYLNGHRQVETEPGQGMLLIVNFPILSA